MGSLNTKHNVTIFMKISTMSIKKNNWSSILFSIRSILDATVTATLSKLNFVERRFSVWTDLTPPR